MLIGKVQEVWRYPVKSMAGEKLTECSIRSLGIPGDLAKALEKVGAVIEIWDSN